MLTNIPSSLPIPPPLLYFTQGKASPVSKITHDELMFSISVFTPQLSNVAPSRPSTPCHACSVFSDIWVWFLLFCGLPEFSSAMLHGGDILPFQVIKSACLYSEILNVVKPYLKKSYTDNSSQDKPSVAQVIYAGRRAQFFKTMQIQERLK